MNLLNELADDINERAALAVYRIETLRLKLIFVWRMIVMLQPGAAWRTRVKMVRLFTTLL